MWQATSEALVLFQMHVVSLLISKICSRNGTRPDTQDEKISQDAVQHAFAGLCVTSSVMAELSSDVNEQLKLIRLHFPDSLLTDCRYRDWIPGEPQPSHLPGQLKEHQSHASCFKDLIIVPVPIGEIYSHFLFQGHNRKWEKISSKTNVSEKNIPTGQFRLSSCSENWNVLHLPSLSRGSSLLSPYC